MHMDTHLPRRARFQIVMVTCARDSSGLAAAREAPRHLGARLARGVAAAHAGCPRAWDPGAAGSSTGSSDNQARQQLPLGIKSTWA